MNETSRVAIYWDLENLHWTVYNALKDRGEEVDKFTDLIDLNAIMRYSESFGRVVVNQIYANWSRLGRYQWQVLKHNMDCVQVFPAVGMKNAADLRIAMDVIRDLRTSEGITHVVLVTGDSDFLPVVTEARRFGVEVVNVALEQFSSAFLRQRCDHFTTLEKLSTFKNDAAPPAGGPKSHSKDSGKGGQKPVEKTSPKTVKVSTAIPVSRVEEQMATPQRIRLRERILRSAVHSALSSVEPEAISQEAIRLVVKRELAHFNEKNYFIKDIGSYLASEKWFEKKPGTVSDWCLSDSKAPVSEVYKGAYIAALELMGVKPFITRHVYSAVQKAYEVGHLSGPRKVWAEALTEAISEERGEKAKDTVAGVLTFAWLGGFIESGTINLPEDQKDFFISALCGGRKLANEVFTELQTNYFVSLFIPTEETGEYGSKIEEAMVGEISTPVSELDGTSVSLENECEEKEIASPDSQVSEEFGASNEDQSEDSDSTLGLTSPEGHDESTEQQVDLEGVN